jgi:hypothetical protein
MKPQPAGTTIENYVYPVYESDRLKETPHLAEIPEVAGFAPFGSKDSKEAASSLPVVQTAVFQDFAQVVKKA